MTRPLGITVLCFFFVGGALVASCSAITLLWPGSVLEPMWQLNPRARQAFASMGGWGVPLLATVSVACGAAGVGLWRGRRWGHTVAVGVLLLQLVGDVANVLLGIEPRAVIGVPVLAVLLVYLTRDKVRRFFGRRTSKNSAARR
jgi:hypothetical protein